MSLTQLRNKFGLDAPVDDNDALVIENKHDTQQPKFNKVFNKKEVKSSQETPVNTPYGQPLIDILNGYETVEDIADNLPIIMQDLEDHPQYQMMLNRLVQEGFKAHLKGQLDSQNSDIKNFND